MTESQTDLAVKYYNQGRADLKAEFDDLKAGYAAGVHDTTINLGGEKPMLKTPDVTPVQVVAVVGAVLAAAAAFGFDLTQQQQDSVMQLVAIVAALLLGGDAVIRHGRATGNAKKDG